MKTHGDKHSLLTVEATKKVWAQNLSKFLLKDHAKGA
jgi:hypothetical protein